MATKTVNFPVDLGGSGTTYRNDAGTNGMAASNGYAYKDTLFDMLGEAVDVADGVKTNAEAVATDRAAVEGVAGDFGDVAAAIAAAQAAQTAAEAAQDVAEAAQATAEAEAAAAAVDAAAAAAAAAAANTAGKVFASTVDGLAGTVDGESFAVFSGNYIVQYLNDSGVADEVGRFYVKEYFDALVAADYGDTTEYLYAIVDSARRALARWRADGTLLAKLGLSVDVSNGLTLTANDDGTYSLSLGATESELPVGDSLVRGSYENADYLWGVVDSAGRRLLTILNDGTVEGSFTTPEVTEARGSRGSVNDRISQYLSDYGTPRRYYFNEHRLRRFRYLRRKRLLGEAAQLVIALIGDSYTYNTSRYSGDLAATLIAELGDAGGGWVGFASNAGSVNGNVRPASYALTRTGTWGEATTANYYTVPGPDIGQGVSSTPGDKYSIAGAATPVLSTVNFFWNGTADGVMRYRWNAGAWTTINVQGSGVQSAALGGLPVSESWTLDIEVVSGTCQPCGIDIQSAASGCRVHKLGATGTRAAHWAAVDGTQWQASMSTLAPDVVVVMHGTNDQFGSRTPAEFSADLTTIVTRLRAARPGVDVLIAMPAENQSGNSVLMSDYASVAAEVAVAQKCAYVDTQYLFGDADDPDEYGSAGDIPLYAGDNIHPDPATGGRVILDGLLRVLTYS